MDLWDRWICRARRNRARGSRNHLMQPIRLLGDASTSTPTETRIHPQGLGVFNVASLHAGHDGPHFKGVRARPGKRR
jgi:hypothetical protein